MPNNQLSIQGLNVFLHLSKSGSMQKAAVDLGLSISTVSHHMRNVEESVGVSLLDHSRRPMSLTPAGAIFARHVEQGLRSIRLGANELASGNLPVVRELRLGNIDDFDAEVGPELAQILAKAMPNCAFEHYTQPSHEIIRMLLDRKLDAGVSTRPASDIGGLLEYPILRDPFVIALPTSSTVAPALFLEGKSGLPLLRYSRNLQVGNLIETHLRRIKVSLPNRFELESNQSMMGMVADGSGWAITTPTSYFRAKRFRGRITLLPFPGKGFYRTLSVFTADDYPASMAEMISSSLRRLISQFFVTPVTHTLPWLSNDFRVLNSGD
jgi:DNA-binding transcriptional LysR family regulator